MNELERQLDYPWSDTLPEPGTAMELLPGVRWLRMGLPFALNHVNLWLLRDRIDGREGWSVVDCCIDAPASRAQWQQVFEQGLDGLPILRVIVTHMHPDHIGLAHWLCERWQAPLWISATDYHAACLAIGRDASAGASEAAFHASHGLRDAATLELLDERSGYYRSLVPAVPANFRRMLDGDEIAIGEHRWRCIVGYGHAPEHIALYSPALGVLIGGDMMLPRISTNISVSASQPEADSLGRFLSSIDRFAPLPADTLTLPSHGKPFRGLQVRIGQLHQHHRERLAELLAACAQAPKCAADVLGLLFRRELDAHQTTFAMGEAVAHLHYLWFTGQVERQRGEDGFWRFGVRPAPAG
ncbi:MBL fold metallo-hydrolase [Xylophilus rhododendri]|uniref:MBL fold metallo-hydrolase n=1 Tax=Xylophilus rhododendri TaxID=2697032 RepID=A0A857J877_9BURK|nr:MBL fold metallo-hydrolase [Xylophilus rhododendri]QHI99281.1 MBL fold metallo-hydrolase [Xylophilus rhododendri]